MRYIYILMVIIFVFSCSENTDQEYINEINDWHTKRVERLKSPTGWFSLAGLFWLEQGENSFGADSSNKIIFPPKAAPYLGKIVLEDTVTTFYPSQEKTVFFDGKPADEMVLAADVTGNPTILKYGSLLWYIIERGERIGIRVKDTASVALQNFDGIERYPVDSGWRVKAELVAHQQPTTIKVPNVLGDISDQPSAGMLLFTVDGKEYQLAPVGDMDEERWSIIFADLTNGEETYGAGRFLTVDHPDENGITYIDFNKAYNPPCAFSPFATCPLPPAMNRLDLAVTAGEKNYGEQH